MKKIIISIVLVAGSFLYIYSYSRKPAAATPMPAPITIPSGASSDVVTLVQKQNTLSTQVSTLATRITSLENTLARIGSPVSSGGTTPTPTPIPIPTPIPTPTLAPAPTPTVVNGYKNGTFAGSPADALYGLVQVQVTIANGSITNVAFLQYPSDRATSQIINARAMPILIQEAIAAQSASVNIVSGATDTSIAFQGSLASALAAAKG